VDRAIGAWPIKPPSATSSNRPVDEDADEDGSDPVGTQVRTRVPVVLGTADGKTVRVIGLIQAGQPCGAEAKMDTHGGYGLHPRRGTQVPRNPPLQNRPVTNNLITSFIATKVLGMPRSY
jgi:hypothetical protein